VGRKLRSGAIEPQASGIDFRYWFWPRQFPGRSGSRMVFFSLIAAENGRFSPFWEIVETAQQPLGEPAESLSSVRTNRFRGFQPAAPTFWRSTKRRSGPSPCGEQHFWQVLLRLNAASLSPPPSRWGETGASQPPRQHAYQPGGRHPGPPTRGHLDFRI
jgi:hypothetical protein